MHILNFTKHLIVTYWLDALIIALFLMCVAVLIKRGKQDYVKRIVYNLVIKAEAALGSGTGVAKYNMVLTEVYNRLPVIIRVFYTRKEVDQLIQEAVDWLKNYLGQGKNLLGYEKESQLKITAAENVPSNAEINGIP